MATMKILGTTDEVTTCDCCGRQDLKSTVAFQTDDGIAYFGCVCASKMFKVSARSIRADADKADEVNAAAKRLESSGAVAHDDDEWQAFLSLECVRAGAFAGRSTKPDRCEQIQALGGYAAAVAKFDAQGRRAFQAS